MILLLRSPAVTREFLTCKIVNKNSNEADKTMNFMDELRQPSSLAFQRAMKFEWQIFFPCLRFILSSSKGWGQCNLQNCIDKFLELGLFFCRFWHDSGYFVLTEQHCRGHSFPKICLWPVPGAPCLLISLADGPQKTGSWLCSWLRHIKLSKNWELHPLQPDISSHGLGSKNDSYWRHQK